MTPIRVMCVDDSPADLTLVQWALERSGIPFSITLAEGAAEALDKLSKLRPMPHLLLLDVNMPEMTGLELLARVKKDPRLRALSVWMLSGSDDTKHVRDAYRLQASGFLQKPTDRDGFVRLAESLGRFCQHLRLPK